MSKMNIMPQRYELPLFMATRNVLRKDRIGELKEYIANKAQLYFEQCKKDDVTMTASHKQLRHLVGLDPSRVTQCTLQPMKAGGRVKPSYQINDWQLPSNIYNTTKVPYAAKKGKSGAYWSKVKSITKPRRPVVHVKFTEKRRNIEKKIGRETSFFLISNAREAKARARIMISTLALNPRNPNEPGPCAYKTPQHEIQYNAYPKKKTPVELPYKFLSRSGVPQSARFKVNKRESFDPAPGRYDIPFPTICPCLPRTVSKQEPRRKKISKARRKWFLSLPAKLHIPGNGHTFLFKGGEKTKSSRRFKGKEKPIQYMSLDYRYIAMINDPTRNIISHWKRVPRKRVALRFNAILRRAVRKRLKINKKIAFLSGRERFPEMETHHPKTPTKETRHSLPEYLRLRDRPITNTPLKDIKPRVYDIFEDHRRFPKLANVKRSFKFPYLPGLKMLLSDDDAHPDRDALPGYYCKNYTIDDYFKFEFRSSKEEHAEVSSSNGSVMTFLQPVAEDAAEAHASIQE